MARKKRYLLRDSDRDGFTYKDIELISDNGSLVGPGEFDNPPPSNRLYPGEGDISPGDTRQFYQSYTDPTAAKINIQSLGASSQINLFFQADNSNFQIRNPLGWFYIQATNSNIALTSNPQIVPGQHGDKIALESIGSNITIRNGSGLALYTSVFTMDSGTICNLIYNATDGLWHEMSRGHRVKSLGAF